MSQPTPLDEPAPSSRLSILLTAASALLVLVMLVGYLTRHSDYVWVPRLLLHPTLFGCSAATMIGLAFGLRRKDVPRALTMFGGGVAIALAWAGGMAALSSLLGDEELYRVPDPGGLYEAVVTSQASIVDPVWLVTVEERAGLSSRRWEVGCVNGDWIQLRNVWWQDSHTLVVRAGELRSVVTVDDRTGQPEVTSGEHIWGC